MSIADGAVRIFSVLKEGALLPEYQTAGSAGADLHAYLTEPVTLNPMERKLIPTGLMSCKCVRARDLR